MTSDVDFVLSLLEERGRATNQELLAESFAQRGYGLTVHSRIADARRRLGDSATITCERVGETRNRRPVYEYRLVREPVQLAFA